MRVSHIRCEYLSNPIGIGISMPRITWELEDTIQQVKFEIVYSVNGSKQKSIIQESSSMNYVFTEAFHSRDIISYQVRIWNEMGEVSDFSNVQTFEIGLLQLTDWTAKWITGNYTPKKSERYPVDYFKKNFNTKCIKKARLYISACGLYETYLNSKRIGDAHLTPGSTDYSKRITYQVYDVTNLLQNGENTWEIELADGWYRGSIGAKGFTCVFGKQTKVKAQLELTNEDGQLETIGTDQSFLWSNDGPIRFADLKDGEIVDYRMKPSYRSRAKDIKFDGNLFASNTETVVERSVSEPVDVKTIQNGKTIYKFPNNIAGYLSFIAKGHSGDTVDITLGELLGDDGDVSLQNIQCIRKGKKTPLQEIHVTLSGEKDTYHTKFFYGGFQYASVQTNAEILEIRQIQIATNIRLTSHFSCSNDLINIFHENTVRSLLSNSVDIPTDCPTRERMGWTGDSQLFFESATYLTDYASFTRKHLHDVFDRQQKNGCLPQIAPYSAEDWFMNVMNGSVGWADVGILTPYRFYKKYGDLRILRDHYEDMVRYAKFMISRCGPAKGMYSLYAKPLHLSKENRRYGVNTGQSYGEWAEPSDVKAFVWTDFAMPHPEESMAYTAYMMRLMIEISKLLGKEENIPLFEEYEVGVTKAYQELVSKEKDTLDTNRQAKLVRPLYMNLLTEEQAEFAKKRLIQALDNYHWRLGTGFLSTPFILYVLEKIDPEYAYKLLENEEMPGWLFMAKNNTGTIWEGWEGPNSQAGIASLNHYSKGALVEWLYSSMCGIRVIAENEFEVMPVIGGKETYANASYHSIYGEICSCWTKENGHVTITISVPSNTKCHFVFGGIDKVLTYGEYRFEI